MPQLFHRLNEASRARSDSEFCDKAVELRNTTTWEEFRSNWRQQMLGERLVEVLNR